MVGTNGFCGSPPFTVTMSELSPPPDEQPVSAKLVAINAAAASVVIVLILNAFLPVSGNGEGTVKRAEGPSALSTIRLG
ncbi:hypothetical protein OHB26_09685 [Nocardia sp. NBC_01503]|uniref:hypothetical protein n=1 Tax=Nocardia sp. NBC_01503 TaxID=2975997 RepID=UPI002E7C2343|nr:hypothetical protein [Nocardia sp. NBC_01503]WTL36601.1 hypothetical protein OHB26_09685 [Nocardia sp. NBC_01503]